MPPSTHHPWNYGTSTKMYDDLCRLSEERIYLGHVSSIFIYLDHVSSISDKSQIDLARSLTRQSQVWTEMGNPIKKARIKSMIPK